MTTVQLWDNQYDNEPQLIDQYTSSTEDGEWYIYGEAIEYLKDYITGFPELNIEKMTLKFLFEDGFVLILKPSPVTPISLES